MFENLISRVRRVANTAPHPVTKRPIVAETPEMAQGRFVVGQVLQEMSDALLVQVVDREHSLVLADFDRRPDTDPRPEAAMGAELMRHLISGAAALCDEAEAIVEITLSRTETMSLFKLLNSGRIFMRLDVARANTTLAVAREVLRHHAPLLVS